LKKVEVRTFDDCSKAEGSMVDNITFTDGIEIREEK